MRKLFLYILLFVTFLCTFLNLQADYSAALLTSTEGDPDSFVQNCVNVLTGDYCESNTDLSIFGPDVLLLQRFYNTKNYITGQHVGGWRIFPQCFLVLGKDPYTNTHSNQLEEWDWTYAFTGERSGGILTYSGWRSIKGLTSDPLRINMSNDAKGMVNTYAREINGQTNHKSNLLHCNEKNCELMLGDGTKRVYKKVKTLPSLLFGEELLPYLSSQVSSPEYFHLTKETLPSGNHILFSYNTAGHITKIELTNAKQDKIMSWLKFTYEPLKQGYLIKILSSDEKYIEYCFKLFTLANGSTTYALVEVKGSHQQSCSYQYVEKDNLLLLIQKSNAREQINIDYDDLNRVAALKKPNAHTNKQEITNIFEYNPGYSDAKDITGIRTRYKFDDRQHLIAIEKFDSRDKLYRTDRNVWGKGEEEGFLQAKYGGESCQTIQYFQEYKYDTFGNVLEKKLYANLTGKEEIILTLNENNEVINPDKFECSKTSYVYSNDQFNLLTGVGDNLTYFYKPGTNLCIKELKRKDNFIKKRIIRNYNDDAVCIQIIEDDGPCKNEQDLMAVSERHIKKYYPKFTCPGVGLPEILEEKVFDSKTNKELLVKKIINTFNAQGQINCCATYDADEQFLFREEKIYNHHGLLTSDININGFQTFYTYDDRENLISKIFTRDNKITSYVYDYRNQLIKTIEAIGDHISEKENNYDCKGRKINEVDQCGNAINYVYDEFGRLIKAIFPAVLDVEGKVIEPTFCYAYDIFGNVIKETDPCNNTTSKAYNFHGKICKTHYPDGSKEDFLYYPNGTLHRKTSRENIFTVFEYDYQGRVLSERDLVKEFDNEKLISCKKYTYNSFRCTEFQDADLITKFTFDSYGRPRTILKCAEKNKSNDLDSQLTEISYDSKHQVQKKKVWFDIGAEDFSIENYVYDFDGNVVLKSVEDATGKILLQNEFMFDTSGRCIEEYGFSNGIKNVIVKTEYNVLGEPISIEDAMGNKTTIKIDYKHYNSLCQKVVKKTICDPFGIQTEIEFDALSRIVQTHKKNILGQSLSNQKIFYDACGNKACEIHDQIQQGQTIGNYTSRWIYGPMGRVEEEIEGYGTDKEKRTQFIYNSLGQLTSKNVPGHINPLNYTYHASGELQSVKHSDDSKLRHLNVGNFYEYNTQGFICKASSEVFPTCILRNYNAFNQMTSEIVEKWGVKYNVDYTYDRKGRIKTIQLPDQSSIAYNYDGVFCRSVQRVSPQKEILYTHAYNEYDCDGRLLNESLIGEIGEKTFEYDLNGKITKIDIPNLYTQDNQYDDLGRLIKKECYGICPSSLSFKYNSLAQLISEQCLKTNIEINTYDYDSLDNRIKHNEEQLICNALNQLKIHGNTEYTYDEKGNISNRKIDRFNLHIDNNILSETTLFLKADKKKLHCLYDALGRRLVKHYVEPKNNKIVSVESYLYAGEEEIGEINQKGEITQLRIPGMNGDKLSSKSIGIEIKGNIFAPIHSVEGNIIALVDPVTALVQESYSYSAYGQESIYDTNGIKIKESFVGNPWRYAEKRVDKETGMVFFGRRYYDSKEGRWISPDPLGSLDGPNCYAYVRNNPLNCHDRFGLLTEPGKETQEQLDEIDYAQLDWIFPGGISYLCLKDGRVVFPRILSRVCIEEVPKISYHDNFEKNFTYYKSEEDFWNKVGLYENPPPYSVPSSLFNLHKSENKNFRIGYINGINNSPNDTLEGMEYISKLAKGYNVHAVYNASHGTLANLYECSLGLRGIATEPVRQLHKMWDNFFNESSQDAHFLMICHSQGAIHVRNALLDYPEHLRNRIEVVAIAPGGYIYQQSCANITHYRVSALRDIVPRFDQAGASRSKDTIVELKSLSNALMDHSFMSPTYKNHLDEQIGKYLGN